MRKSTPGPHQLPNRRAVSRRPGLEPLEDRRLLATFTVDSLADDGSTGTLRWALNQSNNSSDLDTINFDLPGTGVKTIKVTSQLPSTNFPVVIDGTTQNGYSGTPLVVLDGGGAPIGTSGLLLSGGGSTLKGLAINNFFAGAGVIISIMGGDTIQGNFIGTNAQGTAAAPNHEGIAIEFSPGGSTIGGTGAGQGNLISGNAVDGIGLGSSTNVIQGNRIGTDVTGTVAIPNGGPGVLGHPGGVILVGASADNTIGGTAAGAGNLIAGNNSSGIGLFAVGSGNLIQGNLVGINSAGQALANTMDGIYVLQGNATTIGGSTAAARNVISGNTFNGLNLANASGILVQGNYIGVDPTGTVAVPNQTAGISIDALTNSTIGGTGSGQGNLISGNRQTGLTITQGAGLLVQGNTIGLDASGTKALGNGAGSSSSAEGILIQGAATTIGGTTAGAGNVIAANGSAAGGAGIEVTGQLTNNTAIIGNRIGTSAAGDLAFGNLGPGILTDQGAGGSTITNNLISGNQGSGIQIKAGSNTIQGNNIGTDGTGAKPLGNAGFGIDLQTSGNTIGGSAAGAANTIAYNGKAGVGVLSGNNNPILSNPIHDNAGLGIDLGEDGVTPNTPGGPHAGPNNLQNYPVITSVMPGANVTAIQGTFNSTPNTAFTIEFFANDLPDPTGFGQGQTLIGQATVTTDGSGNATINATVPVAIGNGQFIAASATDPSGNTSEFSQAVGTAGTTADLGLTLTAAPNPVSVGGTLTYTITITNSGPNAATGVTLTNALPAGVTYNSATASQGAKPTISNGIVTAVIGTLANGATATVTIVGSPGMTGTFTDTATVHGNQPDTDPSNNTASFDTSVGAAADIEVTKVGLPDPVLVGQQLTYTINVINHGPSTATNVVLTDTLPPGSTYVNATPTQGTINFQDGTVIANLGDLANGALATVLIIARADVTGPLVNSASAKSDVVDSDPNNNAKTITTMSIPSADLAILGAGNPNPVLVGGLLTYTLNVVNNGPSTATGIVLTNVLPQFTDFVSVSAPDASVAMNGNVITFAFAGSLAPGQSSMVTFAVRPTAIGVLTDVASVKADQPDTVASNSTNVKIINAVGLPGAFQFSQPVYSIGENGGVATITVLRTGGSDGFATVNYATIGGNAVPGVNYTPVMGTLNFLDGQTAATFNVPVLDDHVVNGDTAVGLTLSSPTMGATLAPQFTAALAITETDQGVIPPPPGQDGPRVSSVQRFGVHAQETRLVLGFDMPLNAARAMDTRNYQLTGPDGIPIPIASASYNPMMRAVTIQPALRLDLHQTYQLVVNGTTPTGLTDLQGRLLDGNNDGLPGGNYVTAIDAGVAVLSVGGPMVAPTVGPRPFSMNRATAFHPQFQARGHQLPGGRALNARPPRFANLAAGSLRTRALARRLPHHGR